MESTSRINITWILRFRANHLKNPLFSDFFPELLIVDPDIYLAYM